MSFGKMEIDMERENKQMAGDRLRKFNALVRKILFWPAVLYLWRWAEKNNRRIETEPNLSEENKLNLMREYNTVSTAWKWLWYE